MARPAYSTPLIVAGLTPGGGTVYDVPERYVAVVRDVSGYVHAGDTGACEIHLLAFGATAWDIHCCDQGDRTFHWEGRIVVPGPSTLSVGMTGGGAASGDIMVSGYLLSA